MTCIEEGCERLIASKGGFPGIHAAGLCTMCHFWRDILLDVLTHRPDASVRVNGVHYFVCNEDAKGFRGYGGGLFIIEFGDGLLVRSTNVWCQGEIPKNFRDRLPDNASFLPVPDPMDSLHGDAVLH